MSSPKSGSVAREILPEKMLQKKSYAWHAHDGREVMAVFGIDESGLSQTKVAEQTKRFGPNAFTETPQKSNFIRVFEQLKSPLAFVLLLAFGVTAVLEEYVDAGVILFALLIAVFVGVLQEGKASRAFKKLSDSQMKVATVVRDGHKHEIPASELVPGDIVVIHSGMQVPADLRLFRSKQLSINEAALTGEWLPVSKLSKSLPVGTPFAEQKNMAWMGTFVASGQGMGVVIATGDNTAVGKLADSIQDIVDVETPLQGEMKKISHIMLYIIGVLVLGIFLIGVWQGQSLHDMLLMSIAVAVASVPEGLPAAVTIILAVGMESLLKRGGLVRNLLAAETLGSTTYVLTDKTGTLTEAKMTVTEMILADQNHTDKTSWGSNPQARELLDISLTATDAYYDSDNKGVVRGESMEKAIFEAAKRIQIDEEGNSLRGRRVDQLPFDSLNRFAAGLSTVNDEYRLCVNGAPELILEEATQIMSSNGVIPLTDQKRQEITKAMEARTKQGKRLLAVAYKSVNYADIPETEPSKLLKDLVLVGIEVFADPIRKGISEAIVGVKSAGARVLLITGDNPETALAIAKQAGIAAAGDKALTGNELEKLSDEEILEALNHVSVFARVLPNQKMRIATILQQKGEIVAMTGDGINDAPALRRANIGVAVGSGTEVAKESSDLVLINDSFATIYAAIEEGRRIISNLRKIVGYLLATSLSEVVLVGTAVLIGAAAPILPAQILWANVIEEGLMSVAFAFEKGEPGAMRRRPQDIHEEGILSRDMMVFIGFAVTILSMLLLALYFFLLSLEIPIEELRSVMFLAVSVDSLFLAFAFRSLTTPLWKIPLRNNLFFVGSFILSSLLLGIVLTVPVFQRILSYTPLPLNDIILVVIYGFVTLVTIELGKWLFFERKN